MNKIKFYWDIVSPSLTLILIGAIMFFAIGIALSIPLCLLWNWLMPSIFGLPTINVLQAFGLTILISLLSPRKIDIGKKEKTKKYDKELNKNIEDLLQDLSSQFDA